MRCSGSLSKTTFFIALEQRLADYLKWLKVFTALNGTEELSDLGVDLLTQIDQAIAQVPTEESPSVVLMFGTTSA